MHLKQVFRVHALGPVLLTLLSPFACGGGSSVGGQVWDDTNENGVADEGESPVPGVSILLMSVDDQQERSTLTNSDGRFVFEDLEDKTYEVRQEVPFGFRNLSISSEEPVAPADDGVSATSSAIIGGQDASMLEYPFMAFLLANTPDGLFQCGGALIADRYVMTAAHCTEQTIPEGTQVYLGGLEEVSGQTFNVSNVFVHPNWSGNPRFGFDAAIWELEERVLLDDEGIETLDLVPPAEEALADAGELATIVGWGVRESRGTILQEAHVPIVTTEACQSAYRDRFGSINFDSQICAGITEGGVDTCQGDSGGPMLVRDEENQRWLHAGVVSWGDGCAEPGIPGVYTKTSSVYEWVASVVTESSSPVVEVNPKDSDIRFTIFNKATTLSEKGPAEARVNP